MDDGWTVDPSSFSRVARFSKLKYGIFLHPFSISSSGAGGIKASPHGPLGHVPARVVLHRGCVIRHLANRSEMPASGSDSYALLSLVHYSRQPASFSVVTVVQFRPVFTAVASILPSLF